MMTKTQPQIYWAPAKPESKLSSLFADSLSLIQTKRTAWLNAMDQERTTIGEYFTKKRKERLQPASS